MFGEDIGTPIPHPYVVSLEIASVAIHQNGSGSGYLTKFLNEQEL